MKGIELPINTLIIIVIAVIVLVALISFFYTAYTPQRQGINLEAAETSACHAFVSSGCSQNPASIALSNFDANENNQINDAGGINGAEPWNSAANCGTGTTSGDNLATLCLCNYNIDNVYDCAKFCGCSGGTSGGGGGGGPLPPGPPCAVPHDCSLPYTTCDPVSHRCI